MFACVCMVHWCVHVTYFNQLLQPQMQLFNFVQITSITKLKLIGMHITTLGFHCYHISYITTVESAACLGGVLVLARSLN